MDNSQKLKYITDYVYNQLLKPIGYKRRQKTFNKTTEEGIKHVIGFQAYPYLFETPETRKMKEQVFGDMPSYGEFTINLGVWIPGIDEFMFKFNKTKSDFIVAGKCHISSRIRSKEGEDIWYSLKGGLDATSVEVSRIINEQGPALFNRFSTIEQVLSYLESQQVSNTSIVSSPLLLASMVYLSMGNKAKAQRLFTKHYNLPHKNVKHKEHLEDFANELGLEVS